MVSQCSQTPPQYVVPLRPHFFLTSKRGILRGESLIKFELSDIFDFVKPDEEPDGQDGHIMITQIQQGKTSQHNTICGRFMRNRDVKMCPMGSTALYLFHQFEVTQEEFDFSENSTGSVASLYFHLIQRNPWIKRCRAVFYGKMLQHTCGELVVTTDKLQHFGRKYGALYAKMQDIPIAEIEHLFNWSTSQREEAYSTKLPMKALRVMGDNEETKGGYFLARGAFIPPEEL
jgi:hypothetical protein